MNSVGQAKLPPVFYDFEASSIGGLPIEIGWAFADPKSRGIRSEGHLIKPPPHWNLAPVWDPDAEKLHRISRAELIANGRPPFEIVQRMNETLAGRELFSDAPNDDESWFLKLWREARLPAVSAQDKAASAPLELTFTIKRLNANNQIARLAIKLGWEIVAFEAAKAEIARVAPRKHRAEADARNLAMLWSVVSQGPGARN